jgi:hypothetical protein
MPILFDIEPLREYHGCKTYLETGLWDSNNETISLRKALNSKFDKMISIELLDEWVDLGRKNFESQIKSGKVEIIKGDSAYLANFIEGKDEFNEKTLFFLDAHVDNHVQNYKVKCPLFYEIEAIKNLPRKDHVILIDDMVGLFRTGAKPWGDDSYGDINWYEEIRKRILEINPNYVFEMLGDDYPLGDALMICYVPKDSTTTKLYSKGWLSPGIRG